MAKYSRDVQTCFLSDVVEHRMKVHMDNGVYRHLEFSKPGTNCYRFDITTWPGYLCVTGDMGTWTFSRLRDMFEFFGGAFEHGINTGYWSEKFEAGAGCNRDLICKTTTTIPSVLTCCGGRTTIWKSMRTPNQRKMRTGMTTTLLLIATRRESGKLSVS